MDAGPSPSRTRSPELLGAVRARSCAAPTPPPLRLAGTRVGGAEFTERLGVAVPLTQKIIFRACSMAKTFK